MNRFRLIFSQSLKAIGLMALLASCSKSNPNELRVAATPVPHAQILEFIRPQLKEAGLELRLIVTDDFNMPNRALAEKELDANFFQHKPFLQAQIEAFDYPLSILTSVELEPMGAYSKRFHEIGQLPRGATVAVPNDPSNEARALYLLQSQGLIEVDERVGALATIFNLSSNPHELKFIEVDAAMAVRVLGDVDLAVINTNYALSAGLTPSKDALILESPQSAYANVVAIRKEDLANGKLLALKKALTSEKTREFILKTYQGAVLPAF